MSTRIPGSSSEPREADARIREGMALVRVIARRLVRRIGVGKVTVEDLESIGNYSLVAIAERWDPTRDNFEAYATQRLTWAMRDGVRRETHGRAAASRARALGGSDMVSEATAQLPEASSAGSTSFEDHDPVHALDQILGAHAAALALGLVGGSGDEEDPEAGLLAVERHRVLKGAIAQLPERERALVDRHYFGDEPFEKIADELGITRSWASRLHHRALARIGEIVAAADESHDG